jgi:hypothetical protein
MATPAADGQGSEQSTTPPVRPPACDMDHFFDQWVGCLVNSECFQQSEGGLGSRAALKHCAALAKGDVKSSCFAAFDRLQECKLSLFKGTLETPPPMFGGGRQANQPDG